MENTGKKDLLASENEVRYKFITNPNKIDNYDSAILEGRAYLDLDNRALRLEYQISVLEDDLDIINKLEISFKEVKTQYDQELNILHNLLESDALCGYVLL